MLGSGEGLWLLVWGRVCNGHHWDRKEDVRSSTICKSLLLYRIPLEFLLRPFHTFFLCKQESCDFFSNRHEFSHASPSRISTNTFAPRQFEDVYKVRSYGSHRGGALKKMGKIFSAPPVPPPPQKIRPY